MAEEEIGVMEEVRCVNGDILSMFLSCMLNLVFYPVNNIQIPCLRQGYVLL